MRRNLPVAAWPWAAVLFLLALIAAPPVRSSEPKTPASEPKTPGLGDPGKLVRLEIDTGEKPVVLVGSHATRQLVVTGHYASGQVRDLTRTATFEVAPQGIISIDSTGFVIPQANGTVTVRARTKEGIVGESKLTVRRFGETIPVHFGNEVVPVFTKYGCNSGGCHGKSGGQNGFKLSLLGFVPSEDYEWLVKEARGRRLFPAAPDRSLLLLKATGVVPHGGGQRIDVDSPPYQLLRRWIAQGMPAGASDAPMVERIEVIPSDRVLDRESDQQLAVIAHYTDGSTEDVTRMTQFESNDPEMASTTTEGLVSTGSLSGSVAVMTRYQGQVAVFRATIPLGLKLDQLPAPANFIDEQVFAKLKQLGMPPSALSDDAAFLRRVTVDIAGRLPTYEETEAFLKDSSPGKRSKLIDRLLASRDYAEYFATKWCAVLRNKRQRNEERRITYAFREWVCESLNENVPYDQFVRSIITATGTVRTNPAVAWYKQVRDQFAQVEDTAQLFLGLRIQCARCHHHPFEKWSQRDYYGFAAFFSKVARKPGPYTFEDRIYSRRGGASSTNPKTGKGVPPTGLGSQPVELSPDDDPRKALADWMSAPDNPFFARALVNRYWKHFFGRGLVDPEDDLRVTNPASHPELLDQLARHFVESGYDLKGLIRTICNSRTYQLSSEPNEFNVSDRQNFSRYYPKRLNAEVLLDAIDVVTGSPTNFGQVPVGTRAVELPDSGFNSYFLTVFGRPQAASACECERSSEANLAQSLHLINSREVQSKVGGKRVQELAKKDADHRANVRRLYLTAFSREPTAEELEIAVQYIQNKKDQIRPAYEDLVWALINTKEFLFNH